MYFSEEQTQIMVEQFVTAVYNDSPAPAEDKKEFYREVARKQLIASRKFAIMPVTYDNVYTFVFYVMKSSKILGQSASDRFLDRWLNWPGEKNVAELQKVAIFLSNLAGSSHPDDYTINIVYGLVLSLGYQAKTIWDLWCIAPQIIY